MDYATKLIVLLSVATAILLEGFLSARAWPNQLLLTIAAFIVAALSSLALADLSAAIALFFIFLMPALLLVLHGDFSVYYGTIWLAALLGAIVPASVRRGWYSVNQWIRRSPYREYLEIPINATRRYRQRLAFR